MADKGSHENIESGFYERKLHQIDNMSLDNTKEKLERRKRSFECKIKNTYKIKNLIV